MKKSMLYAGLLLTITQATYAEDAMQTTPPTSAVSNTTSPVAAVPDAKPAQPAPAAANEPTPLSAQNPPTTTAPVTEATPPAESKAESSVTPTPSTPVTAPTTAPAIDCHYSIPATVSTVEQPLVAQWAKKAVIQAFSFDFKTLDDQLAALKFCFTDQGWVGFSDALKKSGNLDAIKQEKLNVSSTLNGEVTLTGIKDNQWKIGLPLEVIYQNDKEKINQSLMIDLIVGRQLSGNLGIMQIIAVPKQTAETGAEIMQPTSAAPTPASATAPSTSTQPSTNTAPTDPSTPTTSSAATPSSSTSTSEPAATTAASAEAPASSTSPSAEPQAPASTSVQTPSSSTSTSEPVAPVTTPETH